MHAETQVGFCVSFFVFCFFLQRAPDRGGSTQVQHARTPQATRTLRRPLHHTAHRINQQPPHALLVLAPAHRKRALPHGRRRVRARDAPVPHKVRAPDQVPIEEDVPQPRVPLHNGGAKKKSAHTHTKKRGRRTGLRRIPMSPSHGRTRP